MIPSQDQGQPQVGPAGRRREGPAAAEEEGQEEGRVLRARLGLRQDVRRERAGHRRPLHDRPLRHHRVRQGHRRLEGGEARTARGSPRQRQNLLQVCEIFPVL